MTAVEQSEEQFFVPLTCLYQVKDRKASPQIALEGERQGKSN